jgi:hypothetical protein
MLCPVEQWKRYDGNFDHDAFYKNIVKLFERKPDHRWVRETLAWWNRYVSTFALITNDTLLLGIGNAQALTIVRRKERELPRTQIRIVVMRKR